LALVRRTLVGFVNVWLTNPTLVSLTSVYAPAAPPGDASARRDSFLDEQLAANRRETLADGPPQPPAAA